MKIIFAGTPENAAATLRSLVNDGFDVVSVLTRLDAPVGRKRMLTESPVAAAANLLGLPVIKANSIDSAALEQIRSTGAELGVVVAFGTIFQNDALAVLPYGWINLHYSLLPKHRGAAPVQHALLEGSSSSGVTIFQLDEGMDTGPIWGSAQISIEPRENFKSLLNRLTILGSSLLREVLPKIFSGSVRPHPQEGNPSTAGKPTRLNARLDFQSSAQVLERKVRALNPEPTTWCLWKGEPFQILEGYAAGREFILEESKPLGSVFESKSRIFVSCQESNLELITVKPAGKKEMMARDWYRGVSNKDELKLS